MESLHVLCCASLLKVDRLGLALPQVYPSTGRGFTTGGDESKPYGSPAYTFILLHRDNGHCLSNFWVLQGGDCASRRVRSLKQ